MTIDDAKELADEYYITLEEVFDYAGGRDNIAKVNVEDIKETIEINLLLLLGSLGL